MTKTYRYNRRYYSRLASWFKTNCVVHENGAVGSELSYSTDFYFIFRAKGRVTYKLNVTLELAKKDRHVVVRIRVPTLKFYLLAFFLISTLSILSYLTWTIKWLNIIWLLPVLILRSIFLLQLDNEMDKFMKRVLKESSH